MSKLNKAGFICIALALILTLFASQTFALADKTPLAADKAFALTVSVENAHQVNVQWQIAPGYYLYRDRTHFSFVPELDADIRWPAGEIKHDHGRAPYEIYAGHVIVPLVVQSNVQTAQLTVNYQGCSARGFCYPPMHKTVNVDFSQASVQNHEALQSLLTNQNGVRDLLQSQHLAVTLLIFAGLGLLLAFTPCVLPMVPILTSIIIGHKQPVSTKKAFLLSSTYVLGSALTYAAAGVVAASMGSSLQTWLQQPWIIAGVSALFVILSLSLFGIYDLRLPSYWQNKIAAISHKQEGGTYLGVFIMGIVSTLIVSPCVTAPLVGVLMYIADSGSLVLGASALFAMGCGMGLPLIAIGVSAGKWLPKRGPWMRAVQYIFGVMMLIMAVWMLSRIASLTMTLLFFGALLMAAALFIGIYQSRKMGLVTGIAGILLIAAINMPVLTQNNPSALASSSFKVVRSVADLNQQLLLAQAAHKPVLLDFYADWCESCIAMEKKVFNSPMVLDHLNQFILLRADLSANSAADEMLLKNYKVIAPPTVVFFNNQGREVSAHRIVGELDSNEFITRINTFMTASCDKKITC